MGVDRYRVCELWAAGPDGKGSGSGYRLGDWLVLTARHVIAPAVAGPDGKLRVRPVGVTEWLPARVEWENAEADAALIVIEDERWRAPAGESVLRWGELAGSDPVPCAAVGFPWASVRPDRARDTAHVYGQLAPLGQLKQGRLDLDVASASPSAREGGSPWAGMSGAAVIADNHLVGVITVDPARYQERLVAVPASRLLSDEGFRARLAVYRVRAEAGPVGANWHLQLPGGQTVSLAPPYRPVSRWLRPAPSTLLDPEHGLVPFLGREAVLAQVSGWCQGPPGKPVLLVTGGGGSGKTRLGREACVQMMLVAGWDAGIADDQRRVGAATTGLQRQTLLVIDDADLHTGLISALVGYLKQDDAGPGVRLLLLARAAGDWWDRLVRLLELDRAYTALDLDRHPVPLADRTEHFRCASAAFAAYRDSEMAPADVPEPTGLADPAYGDPLLIHIAALLRMLDVSATSPPSGRGDDPTQEKDGTAGQPGLPVRQVLLRALCAREKTRWYQLGEQSDISFKRYPPLADQVVALATLTAAVDQPCAETLLAALPNQAEVGRIGADALVVWARRLYAGPGYWNPLRPDLLAEQHLADTVQLAFLATTAAQLVAGQRWEAGLLSQMLAELTRGAPNQPVLRAALDELLVGTLPRIVHLAVATDHAELADLASLALQLAPQPDLAATLVDQMPDYSVRLAELATTLTDQQVTQYRARYRESTSFRQVYFAYRLAGSLSILSNRLADLGRLEDALDASEEAISIYRDLVGVGPSWFAALFRPQMAVLLDSLSNRLAGVGRSEDALAASEDATSIYRKWATARPRWYAALRRRSQRTRWAALAWSLNNLSNRLSWLIRKEEALAASEEATGIYRKLATARSDAFRPNLAISLDTLSTGLADQGRTEDALAASEEATGIYRKLATARPDRFRPLLARSLDTLARRLDGQGRTEDALAASEEAVTIHRKLATAHPDAFLPDLADSLDTLAHRLAGQSRTEDALAASEEAVTIHRKLATAHPDAFLPLLAHSLETLARRLDGQGRTEDALAASEEAVTIHRKLATAHPDAFRPDLAVSLNTLAIGLADQRRWKEALAASNEATGIYRELATAHPDRFRHDLATSLNTLANRLADQRRWEAALAASEEAVIIHRELATAHPDRFRPDLAGSLNTLAIGLADQRRWKEALAASNEATGIYRELATAHPDAFRLDLAGSLNNLAIVLAGAGRTEDALAAIQEATGIYRELAARRPDSNQQELERSLRVAASLEHGKDVSNASRRSLSGDSDNGPLSGLPAAALRTSRAHPWT